MSEFLGGMIGFAPDLHTTSRPTVTPAFSLGSPSDVLNADLDEKQADGPAIPPETRKHNTGTNSLSVSVVAFFLSYFLSYFIFLRDCPPPDAQMALRLLLMPG